MLKAKKTALKHQKGEVSLQTIFWVVGITGTILGMVMSVLTYMKSQPNETAVVQASNEIATDSKETKDNAQPSNSPSTKIDHYTVYANGTAVDDTTGMMWMRCSLGQDWNGTTCTGDAKTYSVEEAYQAIEQLNHTGYSGLYGWELPDIESVNSLVFCSNGYKDSYSIPSKSGQMISIDVECDGNHQKPTINGNAFPNTETALLHGYWSATLNNKGKPLVMYFNTGKIKDKDANHYVRAVRSIH